jgi:hypothetical protein
MHIPTLFYSMNAQRVLIACLVGMVLAICPLAAGAGENYYVALLNCQDENKRTHAFALYIKTSEEADGKCNMKGRVLVPVGAPGPEGLRTNLPTHRPWPEILQWAHSINARFSMRGPYPIAKDIYDQALRPQDDHAVAAPGMKGKENKGLTRYLDARTESDMDPQIAGESLYLLVVRGFEPWVQPPGKAPDWLRDRMKLEIGEMR